MTEPALPVATEFDDSHSFPVEWNLWESVLRLAMRDALKLKHGGDSTISLEDCHQAWDWLLCDSSKEIGSVLWICERLEIRSLWAIRAMVKEGSLTKLERATLRLFEGTR